MKVGRATREGGREKLWPQCNLKTLKPIKIIPSEKHFAFYGCRKILHYLPPHLERKAHETIPNKRESLSRLNLARFKKTGAALFTLAYFGRRPSKV